MITPSPLYYRQKNVTVPQGGEIELNCHAGGDPEPTVQWYKIKRDGEEPIPVAMGDRLYIQAATLSDNGFYFCQASTCGTFIAQSNHFRVRVSVPPVLPTCVLAGNGHVRTFDSQSYSFGSPDPVLIRAVRSARGQTASPTPNSSNLPVVCVTTCWPGTVPELLGSCMDGIVTVKLEQLVLRQSLSTITELCLR
eukprot:sb/3470992/